MPTSSRSAAFRLSRVQGRCRAFLVLGALLTLFAPLCALSAPDVDVQVLGTWAEQQILREFAALPLVGEVPRATTVVLRVSIEQAGSELVVRWTYCDTEIDNGSPLAMTAIPSAFLASLGEVTATATLDSAPPVRFVQAWTTEVRGARLADPELDPLPVRPEDPRVFDQDNDGNPGLTVRVGALGLLSGDVYVVQRVRTRLVGTLVAPNRLEGLIEWSSEQVTLDATNPLFLGRLPSRPDPIAGHSTFVLVRVDSTWTCADILAQRASLFEP